ncbi:acyl CoA--acetate/3-ketoacid CoA transferase subunit alpha [bacterium]|nr:MAG: acyl CoA--acetate/3-ketoacid CoA transferase subunit alpha [bacterium]
MKKNKKISVQEAAAEIKNGDTFILAGFTVWRKPMSIIYEMVRQQKRDLHLIMANPSICVDILVGAGCIKIWESNYCGMEVFGKIGNNFARAVEEGKLIYEDYGHYHTVLRLQAGAMGVPFLPSWSCLGTDLLNPDYDMLGKAGLRDGKNPRIPLEKFKIVEDPFYKEGEMVLLPAARADICIAHVQKIGEQGTVRIDGQRFACVEAMKAADKLIVVAEEVVPEEELRREPTANVLPFFRVDAFVECRFGAHPTGVFGRYDMDTAFISDYYTNHSRTQKAFDRWADEWITNVPDHKTYLNKLGGERLTNLMVNTALNWSTNIKRGVR